MTNHDNRRRRKTTRCRPCPSVRLHRVALALLATAVLVLLAVVLVNRARN